MIKNSFRRRMLLVAVLPTLIFTVVLSFIWVSWYQQELLASRTDKTEAIARQVAVAAEFHLFTRDEATLATLLDAMVLEDPDIAGAAVFGPGGDLIVHNGAGVGVPVFAAQAAWGEGDRPGLRRLVMPIRVHALLIDDLDPAGASAEPGNPLVGYVVLDVSDQALSRKRNTVLAIAIVLNVLAMLAGGLLAAYMSKGIVKSITRATAVVQDIGQGKLTARIELDPKCVLFPLERGINRMADQIALTQEDMQRRIDSATAELQAQKRDAELEARIDPLTRLGNRRAFIERGDSEALRAVRYQTPFSLIMLDLDHFKRVNDTYGHDIGDQLLVALAENLTQLMREVDFIARLGGEEFAILMPDTPATEALQVAERLRQKVEHMQVDTLDASIKCTASFGVSEYQPGDSHIQDMFVRADKALYRAKQGGRNRVEHS